MEGLLRTWAEPSGFPRQGSEPWERLQRALTQRTRVDPETVAQLERTTIALENLEPTEVGSRALIGPVTGHLEQISLLLRGSLRPDLRNRLCSIAGETAGIAGWLHWNLGDSRRATAYFQSAGRAGRGAEERAVGRALGASLAKLGRTEEARGLLQSVLARLGPGGERDRAWLTLALATTYHLDREPEEAARVAGVAFARASRINLAPVLALVRGLAEDLR